MRALAWIVVAACGRVGFDPHGPRDAPTTDTDLDTGAGSPSPLHLAPVDGLPGMAPLMLSGTITIDTSAPSISIALPAGSSLDVRPQLGGGSDLAVLHVGALVVSSTANVQIVGTRPFVIAAGGDVDIAGTLDAGAHDATPGAGGQGPGAGPGAGAGGQHETTTNNSDSGGGGAGDGTNGAVGGAISGSCTVAAGGGGVSVGDAAITILAGGSGGGDSSGTQCLPLDQGGAGGGALQITSATTITIESTGRVLAGGGGGAGGTDCGQADVNSGAGGGAGGVIVLQAPTISNAGVVAANGGGGGGSSTTGQGSALPGQDGQPGAVAATGGTGPIATGGAGGWRDAVPGPGGNAVCGNNSSGGGGAVGRIAVSTAYADSGITSPTADTSLPP